MQCELCKADLDTYGGEYIRITEVSVYQSQGYPSEFETVKCCLCKPCCKQVMPLLYGAYYGVS